MRSSTLAPPFPPDLLLTPVSRRPLALPEATLRAVLDGPIPHAPHGAFSPSPRVSILVVTYNGLPFTRLCLESLLANTDGPAYEVIVVDNASADGTPAYLRALAERRPSLRVVLNETNRGFAAANNQALALARGAVLVLLNNDTIVPPGWLPRLARHLGAPEVGLAGPVTNAAGNEAQMEVPYRTYGELEAFAAERADAEAGRAFEIPMLTMFCLALRRDAYERIGPLDERFGVGTFEDDDYSLRARQAGYRVVCAEDAFVHHFGQASFGDLVPGGAYAALLAENQARFEAKWGTTWQPHRHRAGPEYLHTGERVRAAVGAVVPGGATVLVASKGDEGLLRLGGDRAGWHFPRLADGRYAGYYPADGAEAVAQLEAARRAGAGWLVLPRPALWWLEHYPALRRHLERRAARAWADDWCAIFHLDPPDPSAAWSARAERLDALVAEIEGVARREADLRVMLRAAGAALRPPPAPVVPTPPPPVEPPPAEEFVPTRDLVAAKHDAYRQLVEDIRGIVRACVPTGATVLVVSRGDEELLHLGDQRRGWHFPRTETGVYAGHYPADGAEAVAQLERWRAEGAEYLLFPQTSVWWLDHYRELRQHLGARDQRVWADDHCTIYRLSQRGPSRLGRLLPRLPSLHVELRRR